MDPQIHPASSAPCPRPRKEEIAPHDRLIDPELLVVMIDSMFQNALPARFVPDEVAIGAEGVEDRDRRGAIAGGEGRIDRVHEPCQVPEPRRGDGGGRAVVDPVGTSKSQGGTRLAGQRAR